MCVHNLGTTGFVSLGRESDTTTAYRGEQVVSPFPTLPTGLLGVWQCLRFLGERITRCNLNEETFSNKL